MALAVPEDSLQSFPEAFRAGMAARAGQLLDGGDNDPEHWDAPFASGLIHIGVSVFSDSESTWRRTMDMARRQYEGFPGLTVLIEQDFGAQPGDLNPLGYKDSIGQPAIEGGGVDPLPGQGQPVKAGEFILGYPGQAGVPLPMPRPDVLGRNGTYAGLRKYQSRVGTFNRFLAPDPATSTWLVLLPGLILAGIGLGITSTGLASAALSAVEPARAGMAAGLVNTLRQVGTATGVAVLGALYASRITTATPHALAGLPAPPAPWFTVRRTGRSTCTTCR